MEPKFRVPGKGLATSIRLGVAGFVNARVRLTMWSVSYHDP